MIRDGSTGRVPRTPVPSDRASAPHRGDTLSLRALKEHT